MLISQKERVVINGEPIIYSLYQRTTILDTAAFDALYYPQHDKTVTVSLLKNNPTFYLMRSVDL